MEREKGGEIISDTKWSSSLVPFSQLAAIDYGEHHRSHRSYLSVLLNMTVKGLLFYSYNHMFGLKQLGKTNSCTTHSVRTVGAGAHRSNDTRGLELQTLRLFFTSWSLLLTVQAPRSESSQ